MNSNTLAVSSTNTLGDVQLVSSSSAVVENDENITNTVQKNTNEAAEASALVSNDEKKADSNVVQTSNQTSSNYFSELKMERDEMYSKSLETYQKIVDSQSVSAEQKSIAIQEIDKINNIKNAIQISEELIKLKDFEDVVIYSTNDKVSVIVRVAVLSDSQVAQIQNIVSKELGVEINNITISNK